MVEEIYEEDQLIGWKLGYRRYLIISGWDIREDWEEMWKRSGLWD